MLRKLSLVLCLLFLTNSLFAADFFRVAYRDTSRNYDISSDYSESEKIGELGLNYVHVGGFYLSTSVMLPGIYSKEINDEDTGLTIYDVRNYDGLSLGVDALFGIGETMAMDSFDNILTAAGIGAHLNGTSIFLDNSEYIHKYNLGVGFAADLLFFIGYNFNLNLGGQIAWDLLTIIEEPSVTDYSTDAIGSWSWSVYAGIGWSRY